MTTLRGKYADRNLEFCLKEYESLRNEVEWLLTDARSVERNAVIAVGATWVWLFGNHDTIGCAKWAWFIPLLFVVLGALRSFSASRQFAVLHAYIEETEDVFSSAGAPEGWEHFSWRKTGWVTSSAISYWFILIAVVAFVAAYEYWYLK